MKRVTPVLVAVVLFLVGCSSWTGDGVVTGKSYHEPYTTTGLIPVGKVLVPQTRHHPECYELVVRDNVDGKEHDLCFDRNIWEKYEPGNQITVVDEE